MALEINEELDVEAALERLEEIRTIIEQGEISLNESVTLFEEASKLYAFCNTKLDALEERVKILSKNSQGKLEPIPFEYDE